MRPDWKWLIVGILIGYFVVPRLHAAISSRTSSVKAA